MGRCPTALATRISVAPFHLESHVAPRRGHGRRTPYAEAVEEALAFGWIDSRPRSLDAERSMLWFAPRKPRTGWSRANKGRVARLIADGRMTTAGRAKVTQARRDGSWTLLDDVEALVVPVDLAQAMAAYPEARAHFDAFPRSVKRGILEWIGNARRAETRQRRVEETARLAPPLPEHVTARDFLVAVRPGASFEAMSPLRPIALEDYCDPEWAEWYRMSPAERWAESGRLWAAYLALGGSLDPEPDTQSPFFDPSAPGRGPADGRPGVRVVRRGGV